MVNGIPLYPVQCRDPVHHHSRFPSVEGAGVKLGAVGPIDVGLHFPLALTQIDSCGRGGSEKESPFEGLIQHDPTLPKIHQFGRTPLSYNKPLLYGVMEYHNQPWLMEYQPLLCNH